MLLEIMRLLVLLEALFNLLKNQMLLPKVNQNGQVLPPEVSFSIDADLIAASLSAAGISIETTDTVAFMPPETLTLRAADQTVLVSCW